VLSASGWFAGGRAVEGVAKAGETDDVERRGGEASDGVDPSGARRRVELRPQEGVQLPSLHPHADRRQRDAPFVRLIEEAGRELEDLRRPKRRVEHASLGTVRGALGDEDAPAEGAAEAVAREQALVERVRVR
jgi:hypothetical protein